MSDARREAPAAARNRDPITEVLRGILPAQGTVLEIASGSGEHAVHFARAFPGLTFQPSDPEAGARASIDAWAEDVPNVLPALELDVLGPWPALRAQAVLCINMIHIAPWEATPALMAGAAAVLEPGGLLYLYGPYRVGGEMVESNHKFEAWLQARDPRFGVRALEDVAAEAARVGFGPPGVTEMPANNLSVVFRRSAA
ncbi:DUF938 domain-containing protein [Rhodovarius crocodyli]|uniref:DUF938 domain-containing protein n=1 Tax=Rhodovarius crocodyli TaxID=1979269 RepID=A0A437MCZ6_9PROT|nr:DUF938 domain-containing protein [Rhodovarius crocodyli]RVT95517.1 DUF938 domain-containing protein [Rhodovarius crocodyli]